MTGDRWQPAPGFGYDGYSYGGRGQVNWEDGYGRRGDVENEDNRRRSGG